MDCQWTQRAWNSATKIHLQSINLVPKGETWELLPRGSKMILCEWGQLRNDWLCCPWKEGLIALLYVFEMARIKFFFWIKSEFSSVACREPLANSDNLDVCKQKTCHFSLFFFFSYLTTSGLLLFWLFPAAQGTLKATSGRGSMPAAW